MKISLAILSLIAAALGLGYWYYRKESLAKSPLAQATVPQFDATPAPNTQAQVTAGSTDPDPLASFESTDYSPSFGPDANGIAEEQAWNGAIHGFSVVGRYGLA